MSYNTVKVERDGVAEIIRFNRPERRNAVSVELMHELRSAVLAAEADKDVRAVILTGDDICFSAGGDLNEALKVVTTDDCHQYFKNWNSVTNTIQALRKPVLAAIEGFCMTGGLEIALSSDIRVGAAGSSYALTSTRIGTIPGAGGTQRLPRLVGPGKALEMLFSANPIDADEAYRIGLINHLTPKGGALDKARELAAVYAERGPIGLEYAKKAVNMGLQLDLSSGLDLETMLVTAIYATDDKREGISAFLEKRKAYFVGS